MPNNLGVASKQLNNLMVRLDRNGLYDRYDVEISKLLESTYAEIVPEYEIHDKKRRIWYLPHHCVINPNK